MYEGDLIRPLGLVTLYFAYAGAELDTLLETLPSSEPYNDVKRQWPVGRKLNYAQKLIRDLHAENLGGLSATVKQARILFERRNALVHSSIFSSGRMISNRKSVPNQQVSPDELIQLAELIFTWKENIFMHRCRHLLPLLADTEEQHGT
jgi:hypothetical protein